MTNYKIVPSIHCPASLQNMSVSSSSLTAIIIKLYLYAKLYSKHFMWMISFNYGHQPMTQGRLHLFKEVKWHIQGHATSKWEDQDLNPVNTQSQIQKSD